MKTALVIPKGKKEMPGIKTVARPSLGVCYLKAFLKEKKGQEVKVFHQVDETNDQMVGKILDYGANIVGFSTMSCVFPTGISIANSLKAKSGDIVTIFGGEHISGYYADEEKFGLLTRMFFENPSIDFAIPFEGEYALAGLIRALEEKLDLDNVPGIVFRRGDKVMITPPIGRVENLDDLPIADRTDLPYDKYCSANEPPLEYMHTTRGCPYGCTYCSCPISNKGKPRSNSADRVVDELIHIYTNFKRRDFFFADELFTFNRKRIKEICKRLIEEEIDVNWRIFARVSDVAKGRLDLDLMRRAGLRRLFFGVESMNPETLKRINKKTNPEQIKQAVEIAHGTGIEVWGSLMMGYPWESEEDLRKSLDDYLIMVDSGQIIHTYVALITPFPGTPFHTFCIENNLILDPNYVYSDCTYPVIKTPMPMEKLRDIFESFLERLK
jgi:radical SAM superfamily enzyme YgiQ (UPF0313 family)